MITIWVEWSLWRALVGFLGYFYKSKKNLGRGQTPPPFLAMPRFSRRLFWKPVPYPYYEYYFRKFFLWSWSQEVISIMPEFPAKKILIFELYSLLTVNWFRFLWTHSMILSTQFCIDSKTKKKVISDNKKSLKWLSDKHACILWSMNSGQEDIAVLFQRASCI